MSPKKTKKPEQGLESVEGWRLGLLVISLSLLLLLAPIVYRLTSRLTEEDLNQTISSNSVALIVTFLFGATFMLASNSYIRHISHYVMRDYQQQLQSFHHNQRMTFFAKLFSAFAINSRSSSNLANDKASSSSSSSSPFYSLNNSQASVNSEGESRRKIDPKYFKPKFIINELITFWDTTCTVITWGSFYVIGGTIVATEKITQKIKSMPRSPAHRDSSSSFFGDNNNRNSSRGTGHSDCSFGSTSNSRGDTSTSQQQQQNQTSQTYRKISAWTKRSISSIKKKYSRAVRSNAPQLTSGPSSDTGSHIFFFSSPNSSAAAG